jgi:hypothetical protein
MGNVKMAGPGLTHIVYPLFPVSLNWIHLVDIMVTKAIISMLFQRK